jgi:hypothetical protein
MNNDPRQQDGSRRNTRASDGDDQEVYWKKEVDADPIHNRTKSTTNLFSSLFSSVFKPRDFAGIKAPVGRKCSKRATASLDLPDAILRKVQDEIKQSDVSKKRTRPDGQQLEAAFKIGDYIPQNRAELRQTLQVDL